SSRVDRCARQTTSLWCDRVSLLALVRPPVLWRRIDIAGNRRRHPADAEAEKDQQDGLGAFLAPDRPRERENDRPGNGETETVDPIVSGSRHAMSCPFLSWLPCPGRNLTNNSTTV